MEMIIEFIHNCLAMISLLKPIQENKFNAILFHIRIGKVKDF